MTKTPRVPESTMARVSSIAPFVSVLDDRVSVLMVSAFRWGGDGESAQGDGVLQAAAGEQFVESARHGQARGRSEVAVVDVRVRADAVQDAGRPVLIEADGRTVGARRL